MHKKALVTGENERIAAQRGALVRLLHLAYELGHEDEREQPGVKRPRNYFASVALAFTDEFMGVDDHNKVQQDAISSVLDERKRQDEKWGQQDHDASLWLGILGEEFGELCEAVNETVFDNGTDKGGFDNMYIEATHCAAVAVGFLECLLRNSDTAKDE